MHWCFHCHGLNDASSGPCARCGQPIPPPESLTYEEQLIWTLSHPDGDRATLAAQILGHRRAQVAAPALRAIVSEGRDPFLAAAALRSLIKIEGREVSVPFWSSSSEFNRGKSSLINAMLGLDLLPTGVLPLTSIVTTIRHGPEQRLLVRLDDGSETEHPVTELYRFATERVSWIPSARTSLGSSIVAAATPSRLPGLPPSIAPPRDDSRMSRPPGAESSSSLVGSTR